MTPSELGLHARDATIHVLAPEKDIDHFYLGEETDNSLKGFQGVSSAARRGRPGLRPRPPRRPTSAPATSACCSRGMLSNGLAFAAKDIVDPEQPERGAADRMEETAAAVRRRRRVGRRVQGGQAQRQLERDVGEAPRDPPEGAARLPEDRPSRQHQRHAAARRAAAEVEDSAARRRASTRILDTLLPVPEAGKKPTAQAIVSTEREFYDPIPECKLLVDLARRVSNTRTYGASSRRRASTPKRIWATTEGEEEQVLRELREGLPRSAPAAAHRSGVRAQRQRFIDVLIPPGYSWS